MAQQQAKAGPVCARVDPFAMDGLSMSVPQGTLGVTPWGVSASAFDSDSLSSASVASEQHQRPEQWQPRGETQRPSQPTRTTQEAASQTDVCIPLSPTGDAMWAAALSALAVAGKQAVEPQALAPCTSANTAVSLSAQPTAPPALHEEGALQQLRQLQDEAAGLLTRLQARRRRVSPHQRLAQT